MATAADSDPGSSDRAVRRAIAALAVGTIVAFGVVVIGATFLAKQIARDEELAEAIRSGNVLARTVLAGAIEGFVGGDSQAGVSLEEAVRLRRDSGSLVYLVIRSGDGQVVYPAGFGGPGGQSFHGAPMSRSSTSAAVISANEARAEIGDAAVGRMVKVNVPMALPGGTAVDVIMYSTDVRLRTSEAALSVKLVMLSTGAVTLLLLLNLPVSAWLLRGVGKAHQERLRLLANEIAAADRERRNIARDLHDGVIQDLAGASYALDALAGESPESGDESANHILDLAHSAVRRSTQALRTLVVDIAPPDLTSEGLSYAVQRLADRVEAESAVEVRVDVDVPAPLDSQATMMAFRAVRECLNNIVAHAGARHAVIRIRSDADVVVVVAEDDGRGFPPDLAERRRAGHVGLSLLTTAIVDIGGQVDIGPGHDNGATVTCRIPVRPGLVATDDRHSRSRTVAR